MTEGDRIIEKTLAEERDVLAKFVMAITGSISNNELFVKYLTDGIELMNEREEAAVEQFDNPERRLCYLVGYKAAYRDLRNAALRALEIARGTKPPDGESKESVGGDAL